MNPGDAVTGLSEITEGLYRSGSSLLSFHAGSGAKSTSSSSEAQNYHLATCCPCPRQPQVMGSTCWEGDTNIPESEAKAAHYCTGLGRKKHPTNPNSITNNPACRPSYAPPGQMEADVHNTAGNVRRTRWKHLLCLPTLKERHFRSLILLVWPQPCKSYPSSLPKSLRPHFTLKVAMFYSHQGCKLQLLSSLPARAPAVSSSLAEYPSPISSHFCTTRDILCFPVSTLQPPAHPNPPKGLQPCTLAFVSYPHHSSRTASSLNPATGTESCSCQYLRYLWSPSSLGLHMRSSWSFQWVLRSMVAGWLDHIRA